MANLNCKQINKANSQIQTTGLFVRRQTDARRNTFEIALVCYIYILAMLCYMLYAMSVFSV